MPNQTVMSLTEDTKRKIRDVLKQHGVRRASVFGSVARGEATVASDLDILSQWLRAVVRAPDAATAAAAVLGNH